MAFVFIIPGNNSDGTHLMCMLIADFISVASGGWSTSGEVCTSCPPLRQWIGPTEPHGLRWKTGGYQKGNKTAVKIV